jgi:hypothetical protein
MWLPVSDAMDCVSMRELACARGHWFSTQAPQDTTNGTPGKLFLFANPGFGTEGADPKDTERPASSSSIFGRTPVIFFPASGGNCLFLCGAENHLNESLT